MRRFTTPTTCPEPPAWVVKYRAARRGRWVLVAEVPTYSAAVAIITSGGDWFIGRKGAKPKPVPSRALELAAAASPGLFD